MANADRYGQYYWLVTMKDGTDVYVHADSMVVADSGALICTRSGGANNLNMVFAPGDWKWAGAASVLDGHYVAVEHVLTPEVAA